MVLITFLHSFIGFFDFVIFHIALWGEKICFWFLLPAQSQLSEAVPLVSVRDLTGGYLETWLSIAEVSLDIFVSQAFYFKLSSFCFCLKKYYLCLFMQILPLCPYTILFLSLNLILSITVAL